MVQNAEQQNHFNIVVTLPPYLLLSLQTSRLEPRPPGMKVPNRVDYEIPEIKTTHMFTSLSFLGWLCMWP